VRRMEARGAKAAKAAKAATAGSGGGGAPGFLLAVGGLGGLLYGLDLGLVAGALPFLEVTARDWGLGPGALGLVVSAVLAGGVGAALVAGGLAERWGRRPVLLGAALAFCLSVPLMALARGLGALLAGRLLQGAAGGLVGVCLPLLLAESLPPRWRGRGAAVFQLCLTAGLLAAALAGLGAALRFGGDGGVRPDRVWRGLFWTALGPGLLFAAAVPGLAESPRWRPGGRAPAAGPAPGAPPGPPVRAFAPVLKVCGVLVLTQATGVNTILLYLVHILQGAGLPGSLAHRGDVAVKGVNLLMTALALALVDRVGPRRLLAAGAGGALACLVLAGACLRQGAPGRLLGGEVFACRLGFMGCFAAGPGVCVWLVLAELLPARIRARGMGLGLVLNQGVSALLAAAFLPAVRAFGLPALCFAWAAGAGALALLALRLPETRGLTLEEIEAGAGVRAARGTGSPGPAGSPGPPPGSPRRREGWGWGGGAPGGS
jgi:MFS family permease